MHMMNLNVIMVGNKCIGCVGMCWCEKTIKRVLGGADGYRYVCFAYAWPGKFTVCHELGK